MLILGWLVIALTTLRVWGSDLPQEERCVTAVYSTYNYISFVGNPANGLWDTRCQNYLKVASIYAASEVYCRDSERRAGFKQLESFCAEFGQLELLPREAVAENLTEDAIRNMRTVDYLELSRANPVDTPVLISASYFNRMYNTIDSWQYETWSHHSFGYIGYAYWAGILLLGMGSRLYSHIFGNRVPRSEPEVESHTYYPTASARYALPWIGTAVHWVKTHLIVPAPLPDRGRQFLGFTYTTRAEALVVAGFWILSAVLSVVGYQTFPGNIYWPNPTDQILRYSADRTGIMSFVNFPLVWLFGGRNNILIWATGWSFATFNIYHRHVARVATLQGVAHSVLYVVIYIRANKLWKGLSKTYVLWGILAFFVMIFLLVTSLDRVRFDTYEMFLIIHILLSVVALVACFYHTIVFEGHEYWKYLWPSVAIWAFDRVIRMARLAYCNIHIAITGRNQVRATRSRMSFDEDTNVIRLEVMPGTKLLNPRPGDYFFLYQPLRILGWENHPFTVGAWSYDTGSGTSSLLMNTGERNELRDVSQLPLLSGAPTLDGNEDMLAETEEKIDVSRLKLVFWIRPYDGWTQKLRKDCLRSKGQFVDTTILLEGPYGHNFPLWRYESVLMIVGGTGIASAVPYIQDHIRRSAGGGEISEKTRIREIELVWTARQTAFVHDVASRELCPALGRSDFQASFYATGESATLPPNDLAGLGCQISTGRPHIQSLIMSRACDTSAAGSTLVILVCGPAGMADEARAATHLAMRQGYRSIKYVEESFAW